MPPRVLARAETSASAPRSSHWLTPDPRTDPYLRIEDCPEFVTVEGPASQVTLAAFIQQTYTWRRENLPSDRRRMIRPNQIVFTGFVGINLLRRYRNRAGHLSSSASEALTKIGLPWRMSVSQLLSCGRSCGQNATLAQLALTDISVKSHFEFTCRPMCLTFSKRQRRLFPRRTSSVLLPGKASMPWSTGASRLESRRSRQTTQQEYNTIGIVRSKSTVTLLQVANV